jgi:hypothetical protein
MRRAYIGILQTMTINTTIKEVTGKLVWGRIPTTIVTRARKRAEKPLIKRKRAN